MKKYFSFLFLYIASFVSVNAQSDGIPERPNPPRLVNNLSVEMPDFLSKSEEQQLEQKLQAFANETSNQIVVVIVDDLGGREAWDYATELGQKWGVGQEKMDNGIVILIKPTDTGGKHFLQIAVGYGLEGAIPDLTTKRIRENEMNPYFKEGQYYTGLDKGTDVLMALAKGEYSSDAYGAKHKKKNGGIKTILMIIVFVIFIIISIKRGGRGGGNGFTIAAASMFMGGGRSSGGGGFGGGGFGGFGGGGFGGGGSGGSW